MSEKGYLHQRSTNFGKVPYALMIDTSISAGAVRLYAYMHWRYGTNQDNHESRKSMAEAMGVSRRTITKYTQELEQADWIVIIRRANKTGSATNFYHVFELQDDCRSWRGSHKRPKPARELDERKGRKGIGGKPSHKNVNSSSPSKQGYDEVNSSSAPPVNSSSHNPDPYDPENKLKGEAEASAPQEVATNETTDFWRQVQADIVELAYNGNAGMFGSAGDLAHVLCGSATKPQYAECNVSGLTPDEWQALKLWHKATRPNINYPRAARKWNQLVYDFRHDSRRLKYMQQVAEQRAPKPTGPTPVESIMADALSAVQQKKAVA